MKILWNFVIDDEFPSRIDKDDTEIVSRFHFTYTKYYKVYIGFVKYNQSKILLRLKLNFKGYIN